MSECDIINIKVRWNPSDADSETYEMNIVTFYHRQREELLALVKNFKRAVDRAGTTSEVERINYLRTLLSGESLQFFYKLEIQNTTTSNAHLKFIQ